MYKSLTIIYFLTSSVFSNSRSLTHATNKFSFSLILTAIIYEINYSYNARCKIESDLLMTDIEAMIEDCLNRAEKLNRWELGFVYNLKEKHFDQISIKQYNELEKIWEKVT